MNLAIVHDDLIQEGGAERVVQAFHDIWPDAPIFVLVHDKQMVRAKDWNVITSPLQKIPGAAKLYRYFLPLMPKATESHDLSKFDVVLSSTSSYAKGVITRPDAVHVCYCHTPTRYLWSHREEYVRDNVKSGILRLALKPILGRLREWDRMAADRVDHFIANSETVRERINMYYDRSSDVINPPVDTHRFRVADSHDDYFLAGGRLVPYKRFDLIVRAFNKTGHKVKIFGIGPEMEKLRAMAEPNIEFLGRISDGEKAHLFSRCLAFINPQEEDFGITAVEAMAAGRPVIAYGRGGGAETVLPGETGIWMESQDWRHLADIIENFRSQDFDSRAIRRHAESYDVELFKKKIREHVEAAYRKKMESK